MHLVWEIDRKWGSPCLPSSPCSVPPWHECHEDAEPVFFSVLPAELGNAGKGEVCVPQTLTTSLSSSGTHTSSCRDATLSAFP